MVYHAHEAETSGRVVPESYSKEPVERLVISIDFGTTFSGVAFCFLSRQNPRVCAIENWPGTDGETIQAAKVPTLINYDSQDTSKFVWGAAVNNTSDNVVGVKLMLDPSQPRPLFLHSPNVKKTLKKLPKPVIEIVSDYLGAIYRHAFTEIAKEVPDEYLALCRKEFVLTVPAVWSDAAKNATLQAAKLAGIFPVTLIKEPEAAALHVLNDLNFSLREGDAFVLCDAGGGTVDLISYEIEAIKPVLSLKELVPGSGGMAGSLGLNQRFAEAVKKLVGSQWPGLGTTRAFALAERQFDREVKRAFRDRPSEEYYINFPMAGLKDDLNQNLESNTWRMTRNDIKEIFAPLVAEILRLIGDQVKAVQLKRPRGNLKGIFLVGGFGSNLYLRDCIEKAQNGIQVLQPSDAWSAVVKGAALSKVSETATVLSTSATRHYGVTCWGQFDIRHDKGQVTWLSRDGVLRAQKLVWYINIGDDLFRDQRITFPFYRELELTYGLEDLIFSDTLFECQDRTAPLHPSDSQTLKKNCMVVANLTKVPRNKLKRKIGYDGEPYYEITYQLVVRLQSALMAFSLEIDGETFGTVEAKY